MLNDKHIGQWASYLIEDMPYPRSIEESMTKHLWELVILMYKKGYQDCLEDIRIGDVEVPK